MTEKQWQGQVVQIARMYGYEFVYHTWNSQHSPAGFPDLIMLKGDTMVVAELKAEKGTLSPEQYEWLMAFRNVTPHVYLWKPSDIDDVIGILKRRVYIKEESNEE